MGEFVRLETSDGIGTIRLDRPPMNPLNTQVQEELRAAAGYPSSRLDDVLAKLAPDARVISSHP